MLVCGIPSDNLVVTTRLPFQPSWPCLSTAVSVFYGTGEENPWFPFRALSLSPVLRRLRQGLVLNHWRQTGLVYRSELGSVTKSGSCSPVAFSELSFSLPLSHPPTSAASCLQTDLLFKWRKPTLYAFVSGEGGGKLVPGRRQLGLSADDEKKKKTSVEENILFLFYFYPLFEARSTISELERQVHQS